MRNLHSVTRKGRSVKTVNDRLLTLETTTLSKLCKAIDSPRSLMIKLLLDNGEWDALARMSIDPSQYRESQVASFAADYQVTALLSKSPNLPTSFNREEEAVKAFFKAEELCRLSNERLDAYSYSGLMPLNLDTHRVLHEAAQVCREILGPAPTGGDLAYAESKMRFGPGATTTTAGVVTNGAKYSSRVLEHTPRLGRFAYWCMPHLWLNQGLTFSEVSCSRFSSVPKNAKTNRGICIEPDLNIYVQLGLGALLRRKLKRSGLNLDHAAVWNRYLASKAVSRRLTTLDLSAASDTVSRAVVWLLLPEPWAELLHLARVDKTRVLDEEISLEKWSSMGNGYTFELESLLFFSVLMACCRVAGIDADQIACFGDDLIFPSEIEELVVSTLNFLGFNVNMEKSFGSGLFRESCGSDFFNGQNVRPVYFKGLTHDSEDDPKDEIQTTYGYANKLRRWAARLHLLGGGERPACDARCLPAWIALFTSLPATHRHRIPEGTGDNGFVSNWDESTPNVWRHSDVSAGYSGWYYREYFRPMALDRDHMMGSFVATLAGQAMEASRGSPMRGRYLKATTRACYALAWHDLGPWSND